MTSVEVTRSVGRGELAQLLEAHDTWGWADYRDRDNPRHSWSCECGWKSTPTPYGGGTVDTLPAREHTAAAILAALPGLTTTEPGEGFDDGVPTAKPCGSRRGETSGNESRSERLTPPLEPGTVVIRTNEGDPK